jgi:hypothetical protein
MTTSVLALVAGLASHPAEALQRAFVASYGNDANTATFCLLGNPCRGFAAAHSVVDPNGEIVALDGAGYAAVTITKSVTITANPGFYAGISVSTGNGVTIATAGVNVILRGLNINNVGSASNGVSMTNGSSLAIENCVVSNFGGSGVVVNTGAKVRIVDSLFRANAYGIYLTSGVDAAIAGVKVMGNSGQGMELDNTITATNLTVSITDSVFSGHNSGVYASAVSGATTNVTVIRSTSSNNNFGFAITNSATLTVGSSMATSNLYGFYQSGSSAFRSLGNNIVDQNITSNTLGTITAIGGL